MVFRAACWVHCRAAPARDWGVLVAAGATSDRVNLSTILEEHLSGWLRIPDPANLPARLEAVAYIDAIEASRHLGRGAAAQKSNFCAGTQITAERHDVIGIEEVSAEPDLTMVPMIDD